MIELHVPQLHCQSCVNAVSRAIRELDPEAQINAALSERRLQVDADLSETELMLALAAAGYESSPAT